MQNATFFLSTFLSLVIIATNLLGESEAIECFQCSSYEHQACADIPANTTVSPFLHRCEPRDNHTLFCRKTIQTIKDTIRVTRVTRSCGWMRHNKTRACRKNDSDFKLEMTCQCFHDGCNAADRGRQRPAWMVAVSALGLVSLRTLSI